MTAHYSFITPYCRQYVQYCSEDCQHDHEFQRFADDQHHHDQNYSDQHDHGHRHHRDDDDDGGQDSKLWESF